VGIGVLMNWIAEEEAGAAEYDRITERQIAERAISTLVEKPDPAEDIYGGPVKREP
jgi:hypothetical protein